MVVVNNFGDETMKYLSVICLLALSACAFTPEAYSVDYDAVGNQSHCPDAHVSNPTPHIGNLPLPPHNNVTYW